MLKRAQYLGLVIRAMHVKSSTAIRRWRCNLEDAQFLVQREPPKEAIGTPLWSESIRLRGRQ
jgi:hypothetical protein